MSGCAGWCHAGDRRRAGNRCRDSRLATDGPAVAVVDLNEQAAEEAAASASALGNSGRANYSAAKAGIQGFTQALEIQSVSAPLPATTPVSAMPA
jgi:hypothetical protein